MYLKLFSNTSGLFNPTYLLKRKFTCLCTSLVSGQAVKGSYFGYGDGAVWLADVSCHGNESDITDCSKSWTGGVNCDHSNDAGVFCACKTYL